MTSLSQHISCTDQSVSVDRVSRYNIAIRVTSGGFSFIVYDNHQHKYIAIEDCCCEKPINELFSTLEQRKWLLNSFNNVKVFVDTEYKTLVPQALYNPNENHTYLEFAHNLIPNLEIKSDSLTNTDTQLVFAFDKSISNRFANIPIHNSTSVLIESIALECRTLTDKPRIFVSLNNDSFDILTFENGKLLFFNNFKYKTKEDFLYFVLLSMEQQHLSPTSTPVYLIGTINENSEIIKLSEKYINDLRFMSRNKSLNYAYRLEEIPFHYHYILYNSIQCEL